MRIDTKSPALPPIHIQSPTPSTAPEQAQKIEANTLQTQQRDAFVGAQAPPVVTDVSADAITVGHLQKEALGQLSDMAQSKPQQFEQVLAQAFPKSSVQERQDLVELAKLKALPMPEVRMVDAEKLQGHQGAYSAEGKGLILLNRNRSPEEQRQTLQEELGHHFDAKFFAASGDSAGDEGAIFRHGLSKQGPLDAESLAKLRTENDHTTLEGVAGDVELRRSGATALSEKAADAATGAPIERIALTESMARDIEGNVGSFLDLSPNNKTSVASMLLYQLGEQHEAAMSHGSPGVDRRGSVFRALTQIRKHMSTGDYATLLDDARHSIASQKIESRLPKMPGIPVQVQLADKVDMMLRARRNLDMLQHIDRCLNDNWRYIGK